MLLSEKKTEQYTLHLSFLPTSNQLDQNIFNWKTLVLDVSVSNQISASLDLCTGVQGSILGPLLLSLYINDLPSVCPDVETQLYADDSHIGACQDKVNGS